MWSFHLMEVVFPARSGTGSERVPRGRGRVPAGADAPTAVQGRGRIRVVCG